MAVSLVWGMRCPPSLTYESENAMDKMTQDQTQATSPEPALKNEPDWEALKKKTFAEFTEAELDAWYEKKEEVENEVCGGSDRQSDVVIWMVSMLTKGEWTEEEYNENFQNRSTDINQVREKMQNLYDAYMRAHP